MNRHRAVLLASVLGQGVISPAITYLEHDQFTTDRAAGAVNDTAMEPGPGTRGGADTGARLSIASGLLQIGAGTASFSLIGDALARCIGLAFFFKMSLSTGSGSFGSQIGWSNNAGATGNMFWFYNTYLTGGLYAIARLLGNILNLNVAPQYFWIIQLNPGAIYGYSHAGKHRIVYIDRFNTATTPQPMVKNLNATSYTANSDDWKVLQLTGSFTSNYGLAMVNIAAPTDGQTAVGVADAFIEFNWTPAVGEILNIMFRRTDDDNCWILRHDKDAGTNKLFEKNAGVETQRGSTDASALTTGTPYRFWIAAEGAYLKFGWARIADDGFASTRITYDTATFNLTATGVKVSGFTTGANLVITPREIELTPLPFVNQQEFFGYGDSKTSQGGWQDTLLTLLGATSWTHFNIGRPGQTVAGMKTFIVADLSTTHENPAHVLCNLGANDSASMPVEATWKADYLIIVDAMNERWPDALIYICKTWVQNRDADHDTLATWTDAIVAARSFLRAGHDERVWLKGSDNGATMTSDGVHYSVAGKAECAAQWAALIG